jgi:hypothetical protein
MLSQSPLLMATRSGAPRRTSPGQVRASSGRHEIWHRGPVRRWLFHHSVPQAKLLPPVLAP